MFIKQAMWKKSVENLKFKIPKVFNFQIQHYSMLKTKLLSDIELIEATNTCALININRIHKRKIQLFMVPLLLML